MMPEIEYCIVHELPYRKIVLHEEWLAKNLVWRMPEIPPSTIVRVIRELEQLIEEQSGIQGAFNVIQLDRD